MAGHFVGWLLHPDDRARLLTLFPPVYPRVVAHHVTLKAGVSAQFPLPRETEGVVVGMAGDGRGVQALVVEIGGANRRPDGSIFHITWSLAPGRKPVESNDVIRQFGWTAAAQRHPIRIEPRIFASGQRSASGTLPSQK
ncbi:hypothetical protein [Roseomonas sp. BN140053]|uniref:hypothetical protein n=1 Tax=Roseomonas sp. BN140053 TaxID=3391898 RepID=UPI0039E9DFFB